MLGPSPLSGGHIKGFTAQHMLNVMRELQGEGAPRAFAETLPDELKRYVVDGEVLAIAWVPVELYYAGVRHVAQHLGGDLRQAAQEVGRRIARKDIGAFFKMVLGFTSPAMVIGMSGRFWHTFFDFGALTLREKGEGWGKAVVEGWLLTADETSLYELGGGFVEWLSTSRAKNPRLDEVTVKGTDVEFGMSWD